MQKIIKMTILGIMIPIVRSFTLSRKRKTCFANQISSIGTFEYARRKYR